jgi:hypothetical protein
VIVSASIDLRPFNADLRALVERQFPFATANAINATARDVQNAGRNRVRYGLTVAPSKLEFMTRLIEFPSSHRASKRNLSATVGIGVTQRGGSGAAGQRGAMLGRQEVGGGHGRTDADPFFIPTRETRPNDRALVRRALYPAKLGLPTPRSTGGKLKSFVIQNAAGEGGIYRRVRKKLVKVWSFEDRITLKPRLRFIETATKVAQARFEENWGRALNNAMKTAR